MHRRYRAAHLPNRIDRATHPSPQGGAAAAVAGSGRTRANPSPEPAIAPLPVSAGRSCSCSRSSRCRRGRPPDADARRAQPGAGALPYCILFRASATPLTPSPTALSSQASTAWLITPPSPVFCFLFLGAYTLASYTPLLHSLPRRVEPGVSHPPLPHSL